MTKSPLLLLGMSMLGAALAAQSPMTLRGDLSEGRSSFCYYCPNIPYTLKYSETPMRSSTVDLLYYKNLNLPLQFFGYWDTSTVPHGFEVQSVAFANQSLQVPNTASTGANCRITVNGGSGDYALCFGALAAGFVPVLDTAMLIDPATLIDLGTGICDNSGQWRFDVPVPAQSTLIGMRFWTQAALVPAVGNPWGTNPQRTLIDR